LTPKARRKGAKLGSEANRRNAVEAYADLVPFVKKLRDKGLSLRAIAARLNDEGHATVRDSLWTAVQVRNVLQRVA
jgi:hypothetical protein